MKRIDAELLPIDKSKLMALPFSIFHQRNLRYQQDMENEIWKDVKGYEGFYQVSNMGRVKSIFGKELFEKE